MSAEPFAIIRRAIADLQRVGLSIDSFTIEVKKLVELESHAIVLRKSIVVKGATEIDLEKLASKPRTIAGIPVNVRLG